MKLENKIAIVTGAGKGIGNRTRTWCRRSTGNSRVQNKDRP